jgi:hypothetical protein
LVAAILEALGEPRKQLKYTHHRPPVRPIDAGAFSDLQVLAHRKRPENAAAFRHVGNAALRDAKRGGARHVLTGDQDAARACAHQPHDRADKRCFAHPVAAH